MNWSVVSESEPRVQGVEGIVSRTRRRERRTLEESQIDKLTGLQNQDQWVMARPRVDSDASQWVLRLDVDRFKEINDTHGHQAGDSHLQAVANAIRLVCNMIGISPRMQFRSGGDEFTVVSTYDLLMVASQSIQRRINRVLNGGPGTVSIGIGPTDQTADSDMYNNKEVRR